MFEITRKNCYKCDLETIIANDSQYFWINLKDFEAETEHNLVQASLSPGYHLRLEAKPIHFLKLYIKWNRFGHVSDFFSHFCTFYRPDENAIIIT